MAVAIVVIVVGDSVAAESCVHVYVRSCDHCGGRVGDDVVAGCVRFLLSFVSTQPPSDHCIEPPSD